MRILKDPLLHFLVFGLMLFGVNAVLNPPEEVDRVIEVSRAALSAYVQENAMTFDEQWANAYIDSLGEGERQGLVDDYVRVQALYREALARGLERDDHGVRARLVQKLSYMLKSSVQDIAPPSEVEVQEFFEQNKDELKDPARVSFTHVFYSYADHGIEKAMVMAEESLQMLRDQNVAFEEASGLGDIFEFHKEYIDTTPDIVAAHFGVDMEEKLYSKQLPLNQWVGPYESPFGVHLVMVASRKEEKPARFDEVSARVRDMAYEDKISRAADQKVEDLVGLYDVVKEEGL